MFTYVLLPFRPSESSDPHMDFAIKCSYVFVYAFFHAFFSVGPFRLFLFSLMYFGAYLFNVQWRFALFDFLITWNDWMLKMCVSIGCIQKLNNNMRLHMWGKQIRIKWNNFKKKKFTNNLDQSVSCIWNRIFYFHFTMDCAVRSLFVLVKWIAYYVHPSIEISAEILPTIPNIFHGDVI